jgi:hypothetical protein
MNNSSCIFVVIKDEQEYLDDFIKYHLDLGVDHIFIFEDIDSTTHKWITDKYDKVTLNSANMLKLNPINNKQSEYIKSGLIWIRDNFDYDWCFSIDCDEFITVTEPITDVLNNYKEYHAIMLQWKNYGCSGYIRKPIYDKPIWNIYTEECGYSISDKKYCNCTKMCFNMKTLQEKFIHGNHTALCRYVKPDFTQDRTTVVFGKIYIRHYITKSFEEYMWKLTKRGMMCPQHRKIDDFFEMHPHLLENKSKMLKEISQI